MAAEYFPEISREKAKNILKRALELLDKPIKRARQNCRRDNVDHDAKNPFVSSQVIPILGLHLKNQHRLLVSSQIPLEGTIIREMSSSRDHRRGFRSRPWRGSLNFTPEVRVRGA